MTSPRNGGTHESFRVQVPTPFGSGTSRVSIEEDYFARSQIPASANNSTPPRPSSTDLPASLALPLTHSRSSTPNASTPLRAGPSISVDDDSASIRSFVPTVSGGDDLEAMLSEMLGSDARWRMEQDDDIDVWEGESEDDSDSDLDGEGEEPEDEEEKMIRWRGRRKHFFVLSSAGKPIYSRYGDDSVISGYMGVIQAIISFFEDNGDTLRYVR
jgi:vacuolar fusion protein MON1